MKITLLGTGGPLVTRNRACSSILVDDRILLDVGSGSFRNLRRQSVDLSRIERIFLSHFHADHLSDLIPLLWAMELEDGPESIDIVGPKGVKSLVEKLLKLTYFPRHLNRTRRLYVELSGSYGTREFQYHKTIHKPTNYAYVISNGRKSICYSGDTLYHPTLASFAKDCDLLIHESLFTENEREIAEATNHSTSSDAARVASQADVGKLILVHLNADKTSRERRLVREAKRHFSGPLILGHDGFSTEI